MLIGDLLGGRRQRLLVLCDWSLSVKLSYDFLHHMPCRLRVCVHWFECLHVLCGGQVLNGRGDHLHLVLCWAVPGDHRHRGVRLVPWGVLLRDHGPVRAHGDLCCGQVLNRWCEFMHVVFCRHIQSHHGSDVVHGLPAE